MAHNHGNEYQVKIVHTDGIEELSAWMNSQVAQQALAADHRRRGKAYWLRERNVLCPNCLDSEQRIVEYPLTDIPSPRCSPHDSRYLLSVGSGDRYALAFTVPWRREAERDEAEDQTADELYWDTEIGTLDKKVG
jgi:hypothetical protein